ncbi:uncharacterized protein LOC115957537 [Quercus lobata]|uniref:uncharacterized protein LOC115957537 n=1 Tax=Quercus lobata TaxID=97700 RepID=UPI001246CE5D|nr:uncharacterized protein LOC115957537 [Quercus lobata]
MEEIPDIYVDGEEETIDHPMPDVAKNTYIVASLDSHLWDPLFWYFDDLVLDGAGYRCVITIIYHKLGSTDMDMGIGMVNDPYGGFFIAENKSFQSVCSCAESD